MTSVNRTHDEKNQHTTNVKRVWVVALGLPRALGWERRRGPSLGLTHPLQKGGHARGARYKQATKNPYPPPHRRDARKARPKHENTANTPPATDTKLERRGRERGKPWPIEGRGRAAHRGVLKRQRRGNKKVAKDSQKQQKVTPDKGRRLHGGRTPREDRIRP